MFFGVDNTFLTKALASDAFVKYEPTALADIPADVKMDPSGRFTPVDASTVCVDYDKGWFASHQLAPPTDLASLADPGTRTSSSWRTRRCRRPASRSWPRRTPRSAPARTTTGGS